MLVLTGMIAGCLACGAATAAAEVEVNWKEPDSYTDVKPVNETRKGFQERTFSVLEKHFSELAESLPDDYNLSVEVTNVDLAGQVWPASFVGLGHSSSDVRLIKRLDIPRMTFSYTLADSSGKVVKSADVNLKDMGFMDGIVRGFESDSFRYEKNMLTEWYEAEFEDLLANQSAH
ncbi:DUF3016 domain-containing protein [Alteromonas aestuariivivens]|uniref:DUF3016 domain-containing protein n=1 Tax=Alteromonas aestuariivivens TaxID=1938339 RepID=A0A3D8MCT5_9ALTE|nr:DUF3016 domain-containing protein [Alteromonas aestuariivivens]RDV28222.1 DUF3016 domain-containing protein [Alteromonas aestuariivivens]